MSRPRKKILIYHPSENDGALMRYAMQVTLVANVRRASNVKELYAPVPGIEVTVLWREAEIEIRNVLANTYRAVPAGCTNLELMEAVRVALLRKRGPRADPNSQRQRQAAVVAARVVKLATQIGRIDRMMEIIAPRKSRFAA